MFVGSINSKIRNLLFTEKQLFQDKKVCVGCSGNFTIEQILSGMNCEILSNDISLYSSLVGNHLAGKPMRAEILDDSYAWLAPYIEGGGVGRIAAVSLLFEMLKHEKGNNLQQIRMFSHYRNNFDDFFDKSCAKIQEALKTIKIDDYTMVDVYALYRDLPDDWLRVAFLPTYVGGYEKLYARLESVISWDPPAYESLTKERYEETATFMRRGQYLYFADYDRNEDNLFAIVKTGRLKNVYLYSNLPFKKSYILPYAKYEKNEYAYLPDNYEITEKSRITFIITDNKSLNYYKNLFLKKGIDYAGGISPLIVCLDGYVFGFLLFDEIQYGRDREKSIRGIYLLSDFVINSPINKISKLLLLTTKTKELQKLFREKFIQSFDFILTTAFTDKPVSMKYRGVYDLMKRGKGFLQYTTSCGTITAEEAVKTWIRKYKKR